MRKEMYDTIDTKVIKSFQIIKKVGQGAYGQVWKAKNKKTGSLCALKKIHNAFGTPAQAQKTYRQIKYLQSLKHPNIVKLLGFYKSESEREVYLQLQFMEADLSIGLRNGVLKPIHKHYIFYQLVNALSYLHSAGLVHRDIKPTNILVNETCQAKLCDFGLIRCLAKTTQDKLVMTQNVGTRWYRAPQILLGSNSYGHPADIWSLGCVLAEMIMEKPLFQGNSSLSQLQKIFEVVGVPSEIDLQFMQSQTAIQMVKGIKVNEKKSIKAILNTEDANLIDLLQQIFQVNPNKRPTAQRLLSHPFVTKFRGKMQEKRSNRPIKILYESKILSSEEYKILLLNQLDEEMQFKPKKYSQDSITADESKNLIYRTMPQMTRNHFMGSIKGQRNSPMYVSSFNQKGFSPIAMKKQKSPLKDIDKDKSPSEKRSPSFLQNRRKHQTECHIVVKPEQEGSKGQENKKKTTLKRTLTFPLRVSPNHADGKQDKADEKSQDKYSPAVLKMELSDPKSFRQQADSAQINSLASGKQDYSPEKTLKFNNNTSNEQDRSRLALDKFSSSTNKEALNLAQMKNKTPTKFPVRKDILRLTPSKMQCPQSSFKVGAKSKSPIGKVLVFKGPPPKRISPITDSLKPGPLSPKSIRAAANNFA